MINDIGWQGEYNIVVRNKETGQITSETVLNRVMNVALNNLSDILTGVPVDLKIKYLAVGTSDAPITDADIALGNEIFRTQSVSNPIRVSTGHIETDFVILDSEAVGSVKEIGIFAGNTATGTSGTGKLISRILWSKEKTNSEEITIKRIDKVVRA